MEPHTKDGLPHPHGLALACLHCCQSPHLSLSPQVRRSSQPTPKLIPNPFTPKPQTHCPSPQGEPFCRATRGAEKVWNLTQETGSPMYMAPEVYTHQPYNEKADVFSLGIMLYEIFGRTLLVFTHIGPGKGRLGTTGERLLSSYSKGSPLPGRTAALYAGHPVGHR